MLQLPHILLVDDDPAIRERLATYLRSNGMRVSIADSGAAMRACMAASSVDLVILDLILGAEDGLALLRDLQAAGDVPVIMLTAVAEEFDRIIGLELGAEDYVCKPFSQRELLARIRVVLRRREAANGRGASISVFRFRDWTLDVRARTLTSPSGGRVELTTGEFELLHVFVSYPNEVLNRDRLLDLARGRASVAVDRTIDTQVMRLRRKIEPRPDAPQLIKTVRNGGYVFTPEVEHAGGGRLRS
jgi:two-component system, OmpR family, response regulator